MALFRPIVVFVFLSLAAAQNSTMEQHSTEKVGWTSSPNKRSTSDILWSCLSIFLICSWKCVHLNVPGLKESESEWYTLGGWLAYWPQPLKRKQIMRKVKWMCVIAVAPELGVAVSVDQFVRAWKFYHAFQHLDITLVHAFYASMGGFVLALPPKTRTSGTADLNGDKPIPDAPIQELDFWSLSEIAEFRYLKGMDLFPATVEGKREGRALPVTTIGDIEDKSKSDAFTKGVAVVQCGWLIIQSISRTVVGLPITELELMTLSFILCAVVMYGFWWHKPFDVQRPTILLVDHPINTQLLYMQRPAWERDRKAQVADEEGLFADARTPNTFFATLARFLFWDPMEKELSPFPAIAFNTSAALFSGLHLIAWNWEFPSHQVCFAWRVLSVTAVAASLLPFLSAEAYMLYHYFTRDEGIISISVVVAGVSSLIYILARMGLIVLVFYCFRAMPSGVYDTVDWNSYLPHFS